MKISTFFGTRFTQSQKLRGLPPQPYVASCLGRGNISLDKCND